jgi:hypothetical protein
MTVPPDFGSCEVVTTGAIATRRDRTSASIAARPRLADRQNYVFIRAEIDYRAGLYPAQSHVYSMYTWRWRPKMSPNKTLYVRTEDIPVWDHAEQAAAAAGQSVSQLVTASLRNYLPTVGPRADAMEDIRVKVGDRVPPLQDHPSSPADYSRTEAFAGRWLVAPGEEARSRLTLQTTGNCYAVALTRRGQIAVWRYHPSALRAAALDVFATVQDADLPADIRDKALAALGRENIIWRDI